MPHPPYVRGVYNHLILHQPRPRRPALPLRKQRLLQGRRVCGPIQPGVAGEAGGDLALGVQDLDGCQVPGRPQAGAVTSDLQRVTGG
jgi:hypothetical protein